MMIGVRFWHPNFIRLRRILPTSIVAPEETVRKIETAEVAKHYCETARGFDADRHDKPLKSNGMAGSFDGADPHLLEVLPREPRGDHS